MKRIVAIILSILTATSLFASRNPSRYFPFLERPEEYITKGKSHFYTGLFITDAATAFKSDGGNLGIPELWGAYNLKQVIEGLNAVRTAAGQGAYNPFSGEPGYVNYNEKDLIFNVDGKIKSRGIIFSATQKLFNGFSAGFFLPIMHVNSSMRYQFNSDVSHVDARSPTTAEVELFDRVRRAVHTDLGLKGGDWSKSGIGDLDLHLGWRHYWDHELKMRGIDLNVKAGVLAPTGTKRDKDYPSSVPFMGDGNWGAYGDLAIEFELKQNWKVGFIGSYIHQFSKTLKRRIAYFDEPTIFSAISGDAEINPGRTLKFSNYFTIENVMDGLHCQLRYTMLRHRSDSWKDKRSDKSVKTYLEHTNWTDHCAHCARLNKNRLSRWKSAYITMQLIYDSVEAMRNWVFKPKLYAVFDYAYGGRRVAKSHQLTIGAEFNFW